MCFPLCVLMNYSLQVCLGSPPIVTTTSIVAELGKKASCRRIGRFMVDRQVILQVMDGSAWRVTSPRSSLFLCVHYVHTYS
ncbi:hypothetical protein F4777DRAFT_552819 [Nemania sp. FL0916]|nr:hypothetical protein F4777DRAFT_552819 [Nemania sp. FL0916]